MKRITDSVIGDVLFVVFLLVSCNVIKNTPLPDTGINLLKGSWKLENNTDNNALLGSTITIYPPTRDGLISTLQNNSYCVRPNEVLWKDIEDTNGGFNINSLVNSCTSGLAYKPATIVLLSNDEIKLSSTTLAGKEMVQTWKRMLPPKDSVLSNKTRKQ